VSPITTVVGAERPLPEGEPVTQAGARELEPRDRLEVAGHQREAELVGPGRQAKEQLGDSRGDGRRQVGRAQLGVGGLGRHLDLGRPCRDLVGGNAGRLQQVAGDGAVGLPRDLPQPVVERVEAVDPRRRLAQRGRVLTRGALQQRPVDVPQQQQRGRAAHPPT